MAGGEQIPADCQVTCEEAEALLPLVADGALDASADPALFAHLGRCVACQESLARHDLVSLALDQGVGASQPTAWHITLPLPWAFASAAGIALAATATWQWQRASSADAALMAKVAAMPAATPEPPAETGIMGVGDARQRAYVVMQDGQPVLVDPKRRAAPTRQPPLVHPGGMNRY